MLVQNWLDALMYSLLTMLDSIISFLPNLLGAIILLIIGVVVAKSFEFTVEKIISAMKVDAALKKMGLDKYFHRANIKMDSGQFLGKVAYWIILIVFIVGITDILNLPTLSAFIFSVLGWVFTNLIAAILILLIAAFIAQLMQRLVSASVLGAKLHSAKFLGTATWWIVMIFGAIASLNQLGVDTGLIENTIMSFLFAIPLAIGLAAGLAFGLGGKKQAEQILERLEDKLDNH